MCVGSSHKGRAAGSKELCGHAAGPQSCYRNPLEDAARDAERGGGDPPDPRFPLLLRATPPATPRLVQRWTVECEDRLRDCFNCTLWDELCDHGDDINAITECITDYINFCCEIAVPSKMVRCFSNNKPWMNTEIKALLKEKKRAFLSKDRQALKEVQRRLRLNIRNAKARYKNRIEEQLSQQAGRPTPPSAHTA
uniref:Uncharacterized protein n=1 Tax=Knipowitschia caucasica TaxID=637954 RepID=A0AAV2JKS1_KNICA